MSTLILTDLHATNVKDGAGANPSTPAEIQQGRAKAWFNLNGTGTIAARDSFGISSFTDNGVGSYSANYATARPNDGSAISLSGGNTPNGNGIVGLYTSSFPPTTTTFGVVSLNPGASATQDVAHLAAEVTGD